MRLMEFAQDDEVLRRLLETASGGGTSSGSIASVSAPIGTVIRRMPSEPNLFGYVPKAKTKKKRKSPR